MRIRPELPPYPPHWLELGRRARFERAGGHPRAAAGRI